MIAAHAGAAELPAEARVREIVGEALSVALPAVVKLIEHHLDARLGDRPLFHDWRDRR